ncbi:trans-splicing intein-formed DNA polymerase III subunit alpha C-terminal partner DnaE-C [Thermosynechococcaceae cyanobacterium BACA0444]|uniref:Trans-splicing intein-formed DNA polymerase III subunit alpha C-terminal partner DnaE-C n=1 Tax=Pseudocalidococcus azoricus BACA0444 TaxID=2918990 RepID=A0AAE4FS61_9CYAN|nr:OB-fold nucleic acid binding domain-containing protein [Pseudocalidococcus azoricus]MDS3861121.1 trans-splicing intein-formed DNA polymerase III subunit alpha C-terminal partner DnaE-C [Pseudocalidococcus azoricus BACA0444]
MVKIISRRSLGIQPVYDIGVAEDHNFVIRGGLVASNCFNKSHSTAYGYVTFQTAYLKAHYPVEYMAALLTANSGDQDKVQRYLATCMTMGIEIQPPDINRSGVDFTPIGQSILFGLSAVRNVGLAAIEAILAARQDGGEFQSLADFCDRVDPRVANKRAVEALISSGGFDKIEPNRNQLLHDLELVLEWAQGRAKDRAVGQGNLFDMFGGMAAETPTSSYEAAPKAPPVADLPDGDKLRMEKELLGFYVSDHPLKGVQTAARMLAPINLGDLDQQGDQSLSAIVLITELKPIVTKKGDRMAVIQMEDLTGKAEAVVFPRTFERIGHLLAADRRLMVWGKVDQRDDRRQFLIEDAEPIEEVRMIMVELPPAQASDLQAQHRLSEILKAQAGEAPKIPIIAKITDQHQAQYVRLGAQFRVESDARTVTALNQAGFVAKSSQLVPA